MAISIYDIAKRAKVSPSTVSRALQDHPRIGEETRKKIQALAREMDFVPNAVAQSLINNKTRTIGMVVVSVSDPFTGRIVEGVEQAAIDAGFNVLISTSQNDFKRELAVMVALQQRRVDGIIVMASHLMVQQRAFFDRIRVPVVVINEQEPTSDMHVVAVDDVRATALAMEHLLELGHRRIGYVGISNRPKSNQHRLKGYQKALKAAEIKVDEALTFLGDDIEDHAQRGAASLDALLAAQATAVFCYNDVTAIGLLAECRKRGVRVPQDLSVVGFDDIDMAAYTAPPLTTIRQLRFEYGQRAMKMLLAVLNGEQPKSQILPGQLIVRETTMRLTPDPAASLTGSRRPSL